MGLEEILHATPPGLPVDDFPVFVLEDAIAVYEDGTAVNLLAQHGKRKVYIRGRLVRDDGDEEDAGNGSWCKSPSQLEFTLLTISSYQTRRS